MARDPATKADTVEIRDLETIRDDLTTRLQRLEDCITYANLNNVKLLDVQFYKAHDRMVSGAKTFVTGVETALERATGEPAPVIRKPRIKNNSKLWMAVALLPLISSGITYHLMRERVTRIETFSPIINSDIAGVQELLNNSGPAMQVIMDHVNKSEAARRKHRAIKLRELQEQFEARRLEDENAKERID